MTHDARLLAVSLELADGQVVIPIEEVEPIIRERDQLRLVITNAIDNIAHGRIGHAIKALRAARDRAR
jgi:hypothetical protein